MSTHLHTSHTNVHIQHSFTRQGCSAGREETKRALFLGGESEATAACYKLLQGWVQLVWGQKDLNHIEAYRTQASGLSVPYGGDRMNGTQPYIAAPWYPAPAGLTLPLEVVSPVFLLNT